MTVNGWWRATVVACLAASFAGCGNGQSGGDEKDFGTVRARLANDTAQSADFASVRVDVVQGQVVVASQVLTPGSTAGQPAGDAYFVLRPGKYDAMATPLDAKGNPSQSCTQARASADVKKGVTNEIALSIFCQDQGTGGLDVVVTTEHGVVVTGLTFDPSKFVQRCAPVKMSVKAQSVEQLPLTYAWTLQQSVDGARTRLAPQGADASFAADTVGDYGLQIDVSDTHQHHATLTFPVHVTPGEACPDVPRVSLAVDESVKPSAPISGYPNQGLRTLSALTSDSGAQADFVQDELLLQSDDDKAIAGLLSRWNGTEIAVVDFAKSGLDLPRLHLVRVDASAADETQAANDLGIISPDLVGNGRVSDLLGLKLLAVAAHETVANGLHVNLNFVAHPAALSDRRLAEAPSSGDVRYTPNPFNWTYLRAGGAQDIGVVEAWRDLALLGAIPDSGALRSTNLVPILIMDAGFQNPNADFPAGAQIFPAGAYNTPNTWGCSTGMGCVWHGTEVMEAAMGQLNNGIGTVGPAGPVGAATMVQSPAFDVFQVIDYVTRALPSALGGRPRIINMSFEIDLPTIAAPVVDLFGDFTRDLRRNGSLVFAAAGNNGIDVDRTEQACFLGYCVTFRPTLVLPCIDAGVTCVGGLAYDATTRDPHSNYGESLDPHSGTVALFAPYDVWMGIDPQNPTNVAHLEHGTSFSSPFVAGIAALVIAANPALTADQVEQILFDTAHTTSSDRTVPRWVNAHAAVRAALGSTQVCEPPVLAITSPSNGFQVLAGSSVTFTGQAHDFNGALAPSALSWTDNGAPFATGASASATYAAAGTHILTLTARGCSAITSSTSITVRVVNAPGPGSSMILAPNDGTGINASGGDAGGWYADVTFSGTATNADGSAVPDSRLRWSAARGATTTVLGTGTNPTFRLHAASLCGSATYTIFLDVLDASGAVLPGLTKTISVTIYPAPC